MDGEIYKNAKRIILNLGYIWISKLINLVNCVQLKSCLLNIIHNI